MEKPNIAIVNKLLKYGRNVNPHNWSPLHTIILNNDNDLLIAMLLAAGSNIDTVDEHQRTVLMCTKSLQRSSIIKILEDHGNNKKDPLYKSQKTLVRLNISE